MEGDAILFALAGELMREKLDDQARAELAKLTGGGQPEIWSHDRITPPKGIHKSLRDKTPIDSLAVHEDDEFRCCYCTRYLIHTSVLDSIGKLAGNDVLPYVDDHYPGRPQEALDPAVWITHPAIRRHAVQVEHVIPHCRERHTNGRDNTRSACCKCNEWKGSRYLHEMPGLVLRDRMPGWNGLRHLVDPLRARVLQEAA